MPEILTEEDYVNILQKRFKTPDVQFVSADLSPPQGNVNGFMGDYYHLKIRYVLGEPDAVHFFVKTRPENDFQKNITINMNTYEKEIFIYGFLLVEFKKLGYHTEFSPKCYLCKDNVTIVMEDLKKSNYRLFGRSKFFDLPHCKAALRALARFHANSMSYEEKKSRDHGKKYRLNDEYPEMFRETFFIPDDAQEIASKFFISARDTLKNLSSWLPESQEWKDSFLERFDKFDWGKVFHTQLPYRTTCCHGDLWGNNMMFNEATDCRLLDYQLLRHHHPGFDAMLVVYQNTGRDFRKKHLQDLLSYYYEFFEKVLEEHGFSNLLPRDDFLAAARVLEPCAVFQAVAARTFSLLPVDFTDSIETRHDLMFKDRSQCLEEAMQDEDVRKVVIDDIYDLNEHL